MRISGELKIILGAALFAFIPVGVLIGHEMSVYGLLFGRLLLASLLLFLFSKDKKIFFQISTKELLVLFGWSQLMLGAMISYFLAIKMSSISVSSALLGTQPVVIVLLAAILLREKISKMNLLAAVLTLIGILSITGVNDIVNPSFFKGELLAITSAILLGANFILQKKYLARFTGQQLVVFSGVLQLPFLFPLLFISKGSITLNSVFAILLLGIVCTVLAYSLIYNGIRVVDAQKIGVLQSIEYVLPIIIGILFFKESPSLSMIIGAILIIGSCLLVGFSSNTKNH
jgi:drug/metabolite transporter (DMT)-like permease